MKAQMLSRGTALLFL